MGKQTGLVSAFCLTTVVAFSSCQTAPTQGLDVPAGVDVIISKRDKVSKNPGAYVGKKVFVQGRVDELLTANAFLLDYDGFWGRDQILVFKDHHTQPSGLVKDNEVEVTGDVILLNLQDLERTLGRRIDPQVFAKYQNQPVIVTSSVLSH